MHRLPQGTWHQRLPKSTAPLAWTRHPLAQAACVSVLWSHRSANLDFICDLLQQLKAITHTPEPVSVGLASGDFPAWVNEFPLGEIVLEPGSLIAEQYEIL